jgi:Flp pilus assembly protein TadG
VRRFSRCGEQGATIVEAAFVIPLLFLFIFGLIDIGLWEYQGSQASAAARDGARVGILRYLSADTNGSANNTAISNAVAARLGGQSYTLTVTCLNEGNATAKACDSGVLVDQDRIKVVVTWQHPSLTYVGQFVAGNSQTVTGSAVMTIHGLPQ